MRLCVVLGLVGALVLAILISCSQSTPSPSDAADIPDGGGIPDCTVPCASDRFIGAC